MIKFRFSVGEYSYCTPPVVVGTNNHIELKDDFSLDL